MTADSTKDPSSVPSSVATRDILGFLVLKDTDSACSTGQKREAFVLIEAARTEAYVIVTYIQYSLRRRGIGLSRTYERCDATG